AGHAPPGRRRLALMPPHLPRTRQASRYPWKADASAQLPTSSRAARSRNHNIVEIVKARSARPNHLPCADSTENKTSASVAWTTQPSATKMALMGPVVMDCTVGPPTTTAPPASAKEAAAIARRAPPCRDSPKKVIFTLKANRPSRSTAHAQRL